MHLLAVSQCRPIYTLQLNTIILPNTRRAVFCSESMRTLNSYTVCQWAVRPNEWTVDRRRPAAPSVGETTNYNDHSAEQLNKTRENRFIGQSKRAGWLRRLQYIRVSMPRGAAGRSWYDTGPSQSIRTWDLWPLRDLNSARMRKRRTNVRERSYRRWIRRNARSVLYCFRATTSEHSILYTSVSTMSADKSGASKYRNIGLVGRIHTGCSDILLCSHLKWSTMFIKRKHSINVFFSNLFLKK